MNNNYYNQNMFDTTNLTSDYYNYVNNNYNQPYNQNMKNINIYNPYQGYIRGNMFPDLYNTYKINAPFEIEPLNEQADMLTNIDAYSFALTDLTLYLDVYTNDKTMIDLYNRYLMQKKQIVRDYENKYGPLTLDSESLNKYPWAWDGKLPWDR